MEEGCIDGHLPPVNAPGKAVPPSLYQSYSTDFTVHYTLFYRLNSLEEG